MMVVEFYSPYTLGVVIKSDTEMVGWSSYSEIRCRAAPSHCSNSNDTVGPNRYTTNPLRNNFGEGH